MYSSVLETSPPRTLPPVIMTELLFGTRIARWPLRGALIGAAGRIAPVFGSYKSALASSCLPSLPPAK